jgi:Tfp pilus assembly protein PilX
MTKAGSIATVRAMSRWPNASARRAQRGAVLVVGLVMLTVMTLLVVSMIRTSVVELKIGGASQIAQQNLTNAELMINSFLNANNSRFAAHYLALPGATGGPAAPALPGVTMTYDAGSTLYRSTAPATLLYGQANIEVRQIQCTGQREPGMQAGSIQYAFFNVRATATGTLGGSATVNQGVRTVVPSGAC